MAHEFFGLKDAEDRHHAHAHDHDHDHSHFHDHAQGNAAEEARWAGFWLFITLVGGLLVVTSYYVQWFSPKDAATGEYLYKFQMDLVAAIGAILLATRILWHAIANLIRGHMHMDELVALAIVAAFGTGDYRAAGVIAFFLLLSELVETRTAIGARASIEELIKLTPKTARLIEGGSERIVEAAHLAKGQTIRVRPGDSIPADGKVVSGDSTVNQANITGESLPVDKRVGEPVFSGTINLTGAMDIEVTKVAGETTLGQVQNLILKAERTRIPIMRLIDQYVIWYTPAVLMLASLVLFFNKDDNGIQRAIAMLVASCPCALIMATPTAMVAGLSCAARLGILIKDVKHLESAGRLTGVVFDKTGTLTTGILSVTRLIPREGGDGAELLRLAAAAEQLSNHPAAKALQDVAREANIQSNKPEKFEEVPGKGVVATIRDEKTGDTIQVLVGRETFMRERGVDTKELAEAAEATEGMSQLYVAANGRLLGLIGLEDRTRPAAREAVEELRKIGIRRVAMLTGDRQAVARRVAAEMGCTEYRADCLPQEKLDLVNAMRSQGHRVMVIGDGVNDAPALAAGDLGVAMGAAGSDVAINSASIALLNNDLTRIPFLIRLSRATRRVVLQNLVFGVMFVVTVMALGAFDVIVPTVAAVLHALSSFVVVFNSARLVRFGEDRATHQQIMAAETDRNTDIPRPALA
ncbi:MAG: cation-translocating P-type ATPase [Planctomycetia bacterium]|nr:cation-translocating P-type ATPase [Planctomycetia bacterium]MCC7315985.1 cation-translocating P-type ATPase [Planctomycetota bacterium]